MRFIADIHLHSRFARATSRQLDPSSLCRWAALKGIDLVGTGDFTHPEWLRELQEQLEETGDGLLRLRAPWREAVERGLPISCRRPVRFLLSVEISSIYKKNGRTRKVHNLVVLPDLGTVERFNARLDALGNIKSDGRPILGLDSHDLLEIALEVCPEVIFIPAHIWTPHFSALGSGSGFSTLEECYEDLLPHIAAVETGLSSDPPMNWRLSQLDAFTIVSNSDAHSPNKLGREATCFDAPLSYPGLREALITGQAGRCTGTLEFYPQEGKYHYDGHRKCDVCWPPQQTLAADGICPHCGRKLTVGVLHRVELLADRPDGVAPSTRPGFEYLIPLTEVISSAVGVGPQSKRVGRIYDQLLMHLGPELHILRTCATNAIAAVGEPIVAEGIRRMRAAEVHIQPGHDGQYGVISVFTAEQRREHSGQVALFDGATPQCQPGATADATAGTARGRDSAATGQSAVLADVGGTEGGQESAGTKTQTNAAPGRADSGHEMVITASAPDRGSVLPGMTPPMALAADGLDPAQQAIVAATQGPLVVVAGPGSGKTRTLVARAAALIRQRGVAPEQIMVITFTNRAAGELRQRLEAALPEHHVPLPLPVGTFHRLARQLLAAAGRAPNTILDQVEARQLLMGALHETGLWGPPKEVAATISLAKSTTAPEAAMAVSEYAQVYQEYQARLATFGACDYDDILLDLLALLTEDQEFLHRQLARCPYLLVDEFQDVNPVQYELVRLLAGTGSGLMVIGDPDQAIYGFRGAHAGYFRRLHQDFPRAQAHHLGNNYRSQASIVSAAAAVITAAAARDPLELRPVRAAGAPVHLRRVSSETAEGIAVVRQISRLLGGADMQQADEDGGGRYSLRDFAVLFRTGAQSRVLETCFLKEGLPYRLRGRRSFLEADSVRAALSLARYIVDPDSDLRLVHALEVRPFRPQPAVLQVIQQVLVDGGDRTDFPAAGKAAVAELERVAARLAPLPPAELFTSWSDAYGEPEDEDLAQLQRTAAGTENLNAFLTLVLWGQEADFEQAGAAVPVHGEAVSLLTLHAAKGLEFPVVLLCGVEDGLLPFRDHDADLEEERRLLYVGMTRARDQLFLFHARKRLRYGQQTHPEPSPFLTAIPSGLLIREEREPRTRPPRAEQLSLF